MASIPVLDDRQMAALRRITGTNQNFNLVPPGKAKSRRLPSYGEKTISAADFANYFSVERTDAGVRIFDGGNPESQYCGLTDVGHVPVTTLTGSFGDGMYICLRLGVSNNAYTQTFETVSSPPNLLDPVWIIAQVTGGNLVQRWTGGVIYWRQRFCLRSLL